MNCGIPALHPGRYGKIKKKDLNLKINIAENKIEADDLDYICKNGLDELKLLAGNKILLVGGAGFLGYYFVKSILHWNQNYSHCGPSISITVLDHFSRGRPTWLTDLSKNNSLELIEHDITKKLPNSLTGYTYIIHAASIASPTFYRLHPLETMDANVNGLRNLLEYTKESNLTGAIVKGFLYFSTSEIYGDPSPEFIPTPESYRGYVSCTGPRACYDESKRYGETLSVIFSQKYKLPVKIVRPFNNYGPGLKITDKRVIPDFARNIINGEDIVIYSSGSPMRTFCYISDAIIGYYKVLTKGISGESYNIGTNDTEISMSDLAIHMATLSKKLFNYSGSIVLKNNDDPKYLTDNPNRRCPDIKKAMRDLNYNPQIALTAGLEKSLQWYYDINNSFSRL